MGRNTSPSSSVAKHVPVSQQAGSALCRFCLCVMACHSGQCDCYCYAHVNKYGVSPGMRGATLMVSQPQPRRVCLLQPRRPMTHCNIQNSKHISNSSSALYSFCCVGMDRLPCKGNSYDTPVLMPALRRVSLSQQRYGESRYRMLAKKRVYVRTNMGTCVRRYVRTYIRTYILRYVRI